MQIASQESTTEVKQPSISDDNLSQKDYELLRDGKIIEVEESAPKAKASSKTVDESETSKLEAQDSSDDESEESDETSELEKPKKKSGTQRRIEKLVKEREAERREKENLRAQLAQYQSKPKDDAKAPPAVTLEGKPKSDNFETYDDYVEALTEWKADQKQKAKDEEVKKETLKSKVQERVKTHNERVDAYRKDNPEFDKHLADFFEEQGPDLQLSMALEEMITESDNGPAILHELLKTPDELERINSLGAMGIARAIGRLEAKLSSAQETTKTEVKTTKTTKAPPPARPISASSANGKKSPEDMTQSEYERYRDEMEKRRRA